MPRSLSNPEWAQFMSDEASVIASMGLEQFKLVDWDGMSVLIYIAATPINYNGQLLPDVYLSDVSDAPQLQAMLQPGYDAPPQTMLDTLPQAIVDTIASEAAAVGAFVNSAGQAGATVLQGIAAAAGAAAGAATGPIIGNLAPVLIAAAVIMFLIYKK